MHACCLTAPTWHAQEWIPIVAKQSVSTELHSWGSTVRCSQLVGPSVLLIGDAGHAVTPNLGQGCNSALEDVGVFHKVTTSRPGARVHALRSDLVPAKHWPGPVMVKLLLVAAVATIARYSVHSVTFTSHEIS